MRYVICERPPITIVVIDLSILRYVSNLHNILDVKIDLYVILFFFYEKNQANLLILIFSNWMTAIQYAASAQFFSVYTLTQSKTK